MSKIKLGLDIGTNSIGWTVIEKEEGIYDFINKKDEDGNLIPSKGSYIFSKSVDANENSKASERRGFRGARRRIDRIRLRKIATLKVLAIEVPEVVFEVPINVKFSTSGISELVGITTPLPDNSISALFPVPLILKIKEELLTLLFEMFTVSNR